MMFYIPSTADAYHKVREIGCVKTQNICVKKLIVPPKNIPCFDGHSNPIKRLRTSEMNENRLDCLLNNSSPLQSTNKISDSRRNGQIYETIEHPHQNKAVHLL